jgi:fucose permease
LITALLALFPVVCTLAADRSPLSRFEPANVSLLLEDFRLGLVALAVFFFSAVEAAALQWMPGYLRDIGFRDHGRRLLIVGFWGLFLGSRVFVSSTVHHPVAFTWVVLALTCLVMIILGNMIGWHNRGSGGLGLLCLAPCLGPIFPTMIGLTFVLFPHQQPAAFGLVCALGAVGQMVAGPLAQSQLSRNRIHLVMGISILLTLLVALPALVFLLLPPPA